MVPFRHSKLTELFQSFFSGDGRVAMVVNVNPYDTGYDENSHVMKFSAVAQEIMVARAPIPPSLLAPRGGRPSDRARTPLTVDNSVINQSRSVIVIDDDSDEEVVEELIGTESDEDEEEEDVFVEHLLDQIRELKILVRCCSGTLTKSYSTAPVSWPSRRCEALLQKQKYEMNCCSCSNRR